MKRRFAVETTSVRRVYKGVITVADLRKQFNIPDDASITIRPEGGEDTGDDIAVTEIHVSWEQVK